ncbi:hypothetical protein LUZ60_009026 [Juncus effusus]|nr:hypothetical protein LUZ60_009026 [Juncus effusus]
MGYSLKKKQSNCSEMHEHLIIQTDNPKNKNRVPKGCVPVLVGTEDESTEKFVIDLKLLSEQCIRELLDTAAREFGYEQQGLLRIPCEADQFRRIIAAISPSRS